MSVCSPRSDGHAVEGGANPSARGSPSALPSAWRSPSCRPGPSSGTGPRLSGAPPRWRARPGPWSGPDRVESSGGCSRRAARLRGAPALATSLQCPETAPRGGSRGRHDGRCQSIGWPGGLLLVAGRSGTKLGTKPLGGSALSPHPAEETRLEGSSALDSRLHRPERRMRGWVPLGADSGQLALRRIGQRRASSTATACT